MILTNYISIPEFILVGAAFLFLVVQLIYILTLYRRIIVQTKKQKRGDISYTTEQPPVSVVVYACNDADNLEKFLPAILKQNYPKFEVIVVNDGTTDETKDVLNQLEPQNPHLYQTYIPEEAKNHSRRKLAMSVGIKAAKYDWILTTDANCEVAGEEWIATVARNFTDDTQVVLLYTSYLFPETISSAWRSLDNLFFNMRYLGLALDGNPFMGVRRNLAYRKELFFKNRGGFSGYLNLRDGDDDLFINRVAYRENTRIEIAEESVTRAEYYHFDKAWSEQKLAYGITSHYLKNRGALTFGFESFTRYLFYACIIALFALSFCHWILAVAGGVFFLGRFITQTLVFRNTAKIWGEQYNYLLLPVYDLWQPVVDWCYRVKGRMSKKK
ncbi:MAG: glycosyltransferase [Bacteroidota bacterium]|nr:glycosyltransferase [Bacteroidota bacterium]